MLELDYDWSLVKSQRSVISSYTAFLSQSLSSFSMSIIPWSYLFFKLSSPTGLRSPSYCYTAVVSVTWCLSPWSSAIIVSVTYWLSTWSSMLWFQITCYLKTWSSFMWVFLVTCYLSAWSSIMWSWFKVENVNNI